MKVTVAVLDKQRNNVVDRVLGLLPELGDVRTSHFGLVSPKKSLLEKNLDIMSRQGLVSSTMAGYVSSKPSRRGGYEFLQLDDAALVFEGRVYSPIPKTSVMEQVAKEPQHCEALLQTLIAERRWGLFVSDASRTVGLGLEETQWAFNRSISAKTKTLPPLPQTEKPSGNWE